MHVTQVHPVTTENQFHYTRLYMPGKWHGYYSWVWHTRSPVVDLVTSPATVWTRPATRRVLSCPHPGVSWSGGKGTVKFFAVASGDVPDQVPADMLKHRPPLTEIMRVGSLRKNAAVRPPKIELIRPVTEAEVIVKTKTQAWQAREQWTNTHWQESWQWTWSKVSCNRDLWGAWSESRNWVL